MSKDQETTTDNQDNPVSATVPDIPAPIPLTPDLPAKIPIPSDGTNKTGFSHHRRKRSRPVNIPVNQESDSNSGFDRSESPGYSNDGNSLSPVSERIDVTNGNRDVNFPEISRANISNGVLDAVNRRCDICTFETTDSDKFQSHINFHSVALKCWFCHAVFAAAEFLKKHVDQCVNKGKIRDCSYCGQQFFDRESLLSHEYYFHHLAAGGGSGNGTKNSTKSGGDFRCPVCYDKLQNFDKYQEHLEEHLKAGVSYENLECKLCRLTFANRVTLQNHVSAPRHREMAIRVKNLFRCNHCNVIYINRDSYAMHMLEIAREESHNALAQMGIQTTIEQSLLLLQSQGNGIVDSLLEKSTQNIGRSALNVSRSGQDVGRSGQDTGRLEQDTGRLGQDMGRLGQDTGRLGQDIGRSSSGSAGDSNSRPNIVIKKEKVDDDFESGSCLSAEKPDVVSRAVNSDISKFDPISSLINANRAKSSLDFPYECTVCERRLIDQDMLAMHMLQHARENADNPIKNPAISTDKQQPIIKTEPVDDSYRLPSLGGSGVNVQCTFCSARFPSRDSLAMHVMIDHANIPSTNNNATTRSSTLTNGNSGGSYTTLENLINSLYHDSNTNIIQNKTDNLVYKCPVCKITLKDQDALAMHMLLHQHLPVGNVGLMQTALQGVDDRSKLTNQSSLSSSSAAMQDWQSSVLMALYKDQSNFNYRRGMASLQSADTRGGGLSSFESDVRGGGSNHDSGGSRRLSIPDSEVTSSDAASFITGRENISETGELFDGNIIVYDKNTETWSCTVCKVEFRTLLYVTRHLGHVSHKLQVEKRLRLEMCSNKRSSGEDSSLSNYLSYHSGLSGCRNGDSTNVYPRVPIGDSSITGDSCAVYTCNKCNAVFQSKTSYYGHYLNSDCQQRRNYTNGESSAQRQYEYFWNHTSRHGQKRKSDTQHASPVTTRRRTSTQSAPCNPSETRVDIPSPMSVRSCGNNSTSSSFLSPSAIRRSVDTSASNNETEDIKSRGSGTPHGSCTPQTDSTTDVLDFVLKQPVLLMCKFCQLIFCDRTLYYLHMGLHNLNDPWQCNLCGKQTSGVHEFSSHVIHYN